jgi:hypothetical protein
LGTASGFGEGVLQLVEKSPIADRRVFNTLQIGEFSQRYAQAPSGDTANTHLWTEQPSAFGARFPAKKDRALIDRSSAKT